MNTLLKLQSFLQDTNKQEYSHLTHNFHNHTSMLNISYYFQSIHQNHKNSHLQFHFHHLFSLQISILCQKHQLRLVNKKSTILQYKCLKNLRNNHWLLYQHQKCGNPIDTLQMNLDYYVRLYCKKFQILHSKLLLFLLLQSTHQ